jgi:hypothetical protein
MRGGCMLRTSRVEVSPDRAIAIGLVQLRLGASAVPAQCSVRIGLLCTQPCHTRNRARRRNRARMRAIAESVRASSLIRKQVIAWNTPYALALPVSQCHTRPLSATSSPLSHAGGFDIYHHVNCHFIVSKPLQSALFLRW